MFIVDMDCDIAGLENLVRRREPQIAERRRSDIFRSEAVASLQGRDGIAIVNFDIVDRYMLGLMGAAARASSSRR